ncbi:MAG: sigma 54-interacting transcriptional regulator [Candidatus Fermentithermobacillus carboniphilus]|uniref:Sigma 54-interacting transcriptional regulator n=1 Tax=Candidatus Fermentithermobacillus carboniphilus TaxID=3085328 RepID=A0AAT9LA06_9FIRM|nr:MAG: sigma 54-interacting transcriptional regulator [Candidatus Fermentithermobacillus carboniphilus]
MDLLKALLAALEAASEGFHVVDENGITLVYNKAASEIDGLDRSEVVGKHLLEVFPSLDEDSSTLLRVLRTGIPELYRQQTFSNYKGKKITTINSTHPIIVDGKVVGACEISTDITRVKEMAERLLDLRKELRDMAVDAQKDRSARLRLKQKDAVLSRKLFTVDDIIGESAVMKEIKRKVLQVARGDSSIMVWGETGTGKELLVQAIHSASDRQDFPFVPQNCAALPESLLEGLVFGTARGGFTGAEDRPGLLELASGGTLYLDEVDSMPLGLQAKLLRVIQDKRVRRLGDIRERPVDVRIIASTSMPPREAVMRGLLRPDLYYRLSVVEIGLPPLRERKEDIPLLCDHFLKKHAKKDGPKTVSPQVMAAFLTYDWPGNVRELEHAIEGSLNFARGMAIEVEDLPAAVRGIIATASLFRTDGPQVLLSPEAPDHTPQAGLRHILQEAPSSGSHDLQGSENDSASQAASCPTGSLKDDLKEQEKRAIEAALRETGSISAAARSLGIPRQTLQYRMKVLGIQKPPSHRLGSRDSRHPESVGQDHLG